MLALALLAAVTLAPPFGEATATSSDGEGGSLSVVVEVAVDAGFQADFVVVHVLNPDGQETFTMGEGPEGTYSGTLTIPPVNRAIVFEAGRADTSALSRTVSLVDLGVDADLLQTTFTPPGASTSSNNWGWLALAAAALAGFALLVYFAWPQATPQASPPTADRQPPTDGLLDVTGTKTVTDETSG
ncbi:MAG: hypothetical protein KJO97_08235 [Acidimicrobiia bacterium]|nr:hypothetical protein [Acidimicrobiia bacterium]